MIGTFKDEDTRKVFLNIRSQKFPPEIQRTARRKLIFLDSARDLRDLRIPPGNQLEALKGNRIGQHSIRINDQWRIVFTWKRVSSKDGEGERETTQSGGQAYDVEIVDYH